MPRRFIKRHMPNEAKIKEHPHLRKLGKHLHEPNLWHLNRNSVSLAFLVGIFCAFLPIPMQMIVAAVLAILLRCNLPIAIGLVWITNPITMPPIFYFAYRVGSFLLDSPATELEMELSMEWLSQGFSNIWWPLLFGSLVCGVVLSALSCLLIRFLWALHVGHNWRKRSLRRKNNIRNKSELEKD
ncbi:DUF2062 domain-containing protein [Motiliproteus sp. MSK22-1]|uniref:DUF2062 domain-containing protein n=1 Tax=Motiliproteus sp. MSK22-1 TaxID=1897630 RepID=UPI0009759050|nr:DUF2062 domain-containing protein [Motiliproteus sp. MSK22-1]OMH25261.1 ATP-binding protein [Motiliproteus sp. MSK22-1]